MAKTNYTQGQLLEEIHREILYIIKAIRHAPKNGKVCTRECRDDVLRALGATDKPLENDF